MFNDVTEDLTVTATYTEDEVPVTKYTVKFIDHDGIELSTQEVEEGQLATAPANPERTGYTFASWDVDFTNVTEDITVTAKYVVNQYTVTFDTDGGSAVVSITQNYGTEINAPTAPTREGYTFAGWDVEVPSIMPADNMTITAQWTINSHEVKFVDEDGTSVLAEQTVEYGTTPVYSGETPTKEEDAEFTYTFVGWTPDLAEVTGDVTYTATYSKEINRYKVTFVDYNDDELKAEEVEYGNAATALEAPGRVGYTFTGWDVEFNNVTQDLTVTAQYAINQYTITFNSDGGSKVADITADFGATITAPTAPTKEGYTFDKWVECEGKEVTFPETMPVDGLSLKATWITNTDTAYTVEHHQQNINDDGYTVFESETKSGTTDATTAETAKEYTGFKAGVVTNVNINGDGSAVVVIKYDRETYEVKFTDHDDKQIGETQTLRYEASAIAPADPMREGYTFEVWDEEFTEIKTDTIVTATYTINSYTVKFADGDGTSVLAEQTVEYGVTPVYSGETPTKEADAEFTYTFEGWTPEIAEVTGDATYTAAYSKETNKYKVIFVDYNDTELKTETVDYGNVATAPIEPTREGYTFDKWDVDFDNVISNITVTATYTANTNTAYKVEHYQQNINDDEYTLVDADTEDKTGATAEQTAAAKKLYVGFTAAAVTQEEIAADGTTVIKVYYNRDTYTVKFVDYDDIELKTEEVKYQGTAIAPANPTRDGYTFDKWDLAFDNATSDIIVTAKYNINEYRIRFNVTPEESTLIVRDSEGAEASVQTDETYKLKPGDYTYTVIADGYIEKSGSITVIDKDIEIEVSLDPLTSIGDETIGELYIVNRDYTDNNVIKDEIGSVKINIGNIDVTQSFDFTFYGEENGNKITSFDLSEGASTFRVFMEATSDEYDKISTYIIFKYRSVTIEDDEDYYTVEDALSKINSGKIYVRYNTSFANKEAGDVVYKSNGYTIKEGVTLLLPYSSDLSRPMNDNPGDGKTGGKLIRDNAYVELRIPKDIELNIEGSLTINAMRANISTNFSGHVTGKNYSQLKLQEDSKINIKSGGSLNSFGFIYGKGKIEAEAGSNIYESMFVKSFRGGSATLNIYSNVFPFDQYTVNNIEADMIINSGANYTGNALIYASNSYTGGDAKLVGSIDDYLLQLIEGKIIKTYDQMTGRVSFEIQGNANINDTSFRVGGVTASSKGRDLPFDGTWSINASDGSKITINSWVMLLPGSSLNINPKAEVTVNENAKITVFNPYEYLDDYSEYPVDSKDYYRTSPNFDFKNATLATFNIDGKLIVKGGLAGRVHKRDAGSIDFEESSYTTYGINYVLGSARNAKVKSREVNLWYEGDSTIETISDKDNAKSGEEVKITVTARNSNGDPLENINVKFSGGSNTWNADTVTTDNYGKAIGTYTLGDNDSGEFKVSATVNIDGKEISAGANIEVGGSTCPLVYSYDGENYHLEHEPVRGSVAKSFETTSHGTLRKLEEVDGKYNIRITEEMDTETFVNGFSLYTVDYLEGNEVEGVFVDIFGRPHTIKTNISPKSFVDSKGNSYLDKITTKGKLVLADVNKIQKGQLIESYEAVFDRPYDSNNIAKLIVSANGQKITSDSVDWVYDFLDAQNNMWWLSEVFERSPNSSSISNATNFTSLEIDLWDGRQWLKQGTITTGTDLLEKFLIPLDLSVLDKEVKEVRVRLRSGTGFYEIDQVSMDFTKNENMNIHKLDLNSALLNDVAKVKHIIDDFDNEQRVEMHKGDHIDLYYNSPKLKEGYKRGFVVDFKGYFHHLNNSRRNEIVDTWKDITYEELINQVILEQPEVVDFFPTLEYFYELVESMNGKPLEYKIEKIIIDHVLPWLNAK